MPGDYYVVGGPDGQSPRSRVLVFASAIALAAVALVAAFYLLRPLGQISSKPPTPPNNPAPPQPPPPIPTAPNVLSELRLSCLDAANKLAAAEKSQENFLARFRNAVGYSIDHIQSHESQRPRELDFALLESQPFNRAWTHVLNARVAEAEFATRREMLATVDKRIHEKSAEPSDKQVLSELAAWAEKTRATLDGELSNLDTIRETLENYREDPRIRGEKRRPP